jgi:hypothetical protein
MFVLHVIHLGSSIPKYEYGFKEEVEAVKSKPKQNPIPPQSQVIKNGKQFLELNILLYMKQLLMNLNYWILAESSENVFANL